jgi:folate-binding protein YgfZ
MLAALPHNHTPPPAAIATHLKCASLVHRNTRPNSAFVMTKPYLAQSVLIEGADAIAFAQAQFSSNVAALAVGQWQFSAWLDPQGRVKAFFHLARTRDQSLQLLLRGGEAVDVVNALKRFVFRSKVTLTALSPRALSEGPAMPLYTLESAQENLVLGCDTHSLCASDEGVGDSAWRAKQLRQGWPWLPPSLLSELLPPALSLHRLNAVVIDKGCYPGQEIVARLHYRGGNKKRLHRVEISPSQSAASCVAGAVLRASSDEKIQLLDVIHDDSHTEALAVLNASLTATAVNDTIVCADDRTEVRLIEAWNA